MAFGYSDRNRIIDSIRNKRRVSNQRTSAAAAAAAAAAGGTAAAARPTSSSSTPYEPPSAELESVLADAVTQSNWDEAPTSKTKGNKGVCAYEVLLLLLVTWCLIIRKSPLYGTTAGYGDIFTSQFMLKIGLLKIYSNVNRCY